jgi:hypothetical protein
MREPRFIPEFAASQVLVLDNSNGSVHLSIHNNGGHSSMDMAASVAIQLADELRLRATESLDSKRKVEDAK